MNREQYVEYVAKLIGFHTPPDYVRELIERQYDQRATVLRAADEVREYLQVRRPGDA